MKKIDLIDKYASSTQNMPKIEYAKKLINSSLPQTKEGKRLKMELVSLLELYRIENHKEFNRLEEILEVSLKD